MASCIVLKEYDRQRACVSQISMTCWGYRLLLLLLLIMSLPEPRAGTSSRASVPLRSGVSGQLGVLQRLRGGQGAQVSAGESKADVPEVAVTVASGEGDDRIEMIHVRHGTSVAELKAMLEPLFGIEASKQVLSCRSAALNDSQTVGSSTLCNEELVVLTTKKHAEPQACRNVLNAEALRKALAQVSNGANMQRMDVDAESMRHTLSQCAPQAHARQHGGYLAGQSSAALGAPLPEPKVVLATEVNQTDRPALLVR